MKPIKVILTTFIVAFFMCAATDTSATPSEVQFVPIKAPTLDTYRQKLRREHPRLLITSVDVLRIKQLVQDDVLAKQIYLQVKKKADEILDEPVSKYELPDGKRLSASRRVLVCSYTLGLVWLVGSEQRYRDRLWQELKAAGDFKDWNPKQYIETAEMMHAFAIAYDWLYNSWTESERKFLKEAMVEKGLKLSDALFKKGGGWVKGSNNWNFVCSGGSAMAALAILDEEQNLCSAVLTGAFESIQPAMSKFEPDGIWYEGPGYWHFSIKHLVPYITALETVFGTDFGLRAKFPGFMKTADFPIYSTGPGGVFNFADTSVRSGAFRAPEFFWFAAKTGNPLYGWYASKHPANVAEDLVYYRPDTLAATMPNRLLDQRLHGDETEVASMRSSWDDTKAMFTALKAGRNGRSHGHIDLGSFVLDVGKTRFIEDLGLDDYNMPAYFGKERWTYYRLRAEGHNTLLINPASGPDQNLSARANIMSFGAVPQSASVAVDLSSAYSDAEHVYRELRLEDNRTCTRVTDEIKLKQTGQIWWFAHTKARVMVKPDGRTAILSRGSVQLEAHLEAPSDARFTVMEATPLPSSPNPSMQNKNANMRKLVIRLDNISQTTLTVAFKLAPQTVPTQKTLPENEP